MPSSFNFKVTVPPVIFLLDWGANKLLGECPRPPVWLFILLTLNGGFVIEWLFLKRGPLLVYAVIAMKSEPAYCSSCTITLLLVREYYLVFWFPSRRMPLVTQGMLTFARLLLVESCFA